MKNSIRWVILIAVSFCVAACQSTPEQTPISSSVVRQYTAQEIEVRKAEKLDLGASPFLKEERAFLADQFVDLLKDELPENLRFNLLGQKPAKVEIRLETVSISSAAGRQLSGEGSNVIANVKITDLEDGRVVAQSKIAASDAAARNSTVIGGVPVGAVASFIENRNATEGSAQVVTIRDKFLKEMNRWLSLR